MPEIREIRRRLDNIGESLSEIDNQLKKSLKRLYEPKFLAIVEGFFEGMYLGAVATTPIQLYLWCYLLRQITSC